VSILAVIPARLGATRLPRKPLRLVGGAPLVVRVLERAVAVGVAERCVVATDSAEVLDAVRRAGGECVLTAAEHPSGTDRVAEVAALAAYRAYDTIVNIQGDEPFASADAVRGAVDCVASGRFPLGTVSRRSRPMRSTNRPW
jgi:3-deoxy-manno-octulosonate cytidylyltransferase (CMP-KDO synthetase)